MKKKLLATAVLAASMLIAGPAYAADDIAVTVNGNPLTFDVAPQIVDGRTMVPMRAIFEEFGMVVDWDGSDRTIFARNGETSIRMQIDNKMSTKNGMQVENDVAPMVLNGRTMVPLRFIATALDMNPNWNRETRTVEIVMEDDSYKEYRAWYETDKDKNIRIQTNVPMKGYDGGTIKLEASANGGYEYEGIDYNQEYAGMSLYCGFYDIGRAQYTIPSMKVSVYRGRYLTLDGDDSFTIKGEPDVELRLNQPLQYKCAGNPIVIESVDLKMTENRAEYTFRVAEKLKSYGSYSAHMLFTTGGGRSTYLAKKGDTLVSYREDIGHFRHDGNFYVLHSYAEVDNNGAATVTYTPATKAFAWKGSH